LAERYANISVDPVVFRTRQLLPVVNGALIGVALQLDKVAPALAERVAENPLGLALVLGLWTIGSWMIFRAE